MKILFTLPDDQEYESFWGPIKALENLNEIPFTPYSKKDRFGRAADWTNHNVSRQSHCTGCYWHRSTQVNTAARGGSYDGGSLQTNRTFRPRTQQEQQPIVQSTQNGQHTKSTRVSIRAYQMRTVHSPSADIRSEWRLVDEMEFSPTLNKVCYNTGEPHEVMLSGTMGSYIKCNDVISSRKEKPLQKTERMFYSLTILKDPLIQWLAGHSQATIFTTDSLISTLMCATRPGYCWDIVVTKKDDILFLDKREGSPVDFITVNETIDSDPIPEEKDNMNGLPSLFYEATFINQSFSEQVRDSSLERLATDWLNPYAGNINLDKRVPAAYKYRIWSLGSKRIVVRCVIKTCADVRRQWQPVHVHAFNEFDAKTGLDWRNKLEIQRGAIFATEIKNNALKVAKWTGMALLSGVELLKIGYIVRNRPLENDHHGVIGLQTLKARDLAAQINLSLDSCWGITKRIIEFVNKLDDGKYLLLRYPKKSRVSIYQVPFDTFDRERRNAEGMDRSFA